MRGWEDKNSTRSSFSERVALCTLFRTTAVTKRCVLESMGRKVLTRTNVVVWYKVLSSYFWFVIKFYAWNGLNVWITVEFIRNLLHSKLFVSRQVAFILITWYSQLLHSTLNTMASVNKRTEMASIKQQSDMLRMLTYSGNDHLIYRIQYIDMAWLPTIEFTARQKTTTNPAIGTHLIIIHILIEKTHIHHWYNGLQQTQQLLNAHHNDRQYVHRMLNIKHDYLSLCVDYKIVWGFSLRVWPYLLQSIRVIIQS